jgi:hypothetical protein
MEEGGERVLSEAEFPPKVQWGKKPWKRFSFLPRTQAQRLRGEGLGSGRSAARGRGKILDGESGEMQDDGGGGKAAERNREHLRPEKKKRTGRGEARKQSVYSRQKSGDETRKRGGGRGRAREAQQQRIAIAETGEGTGEEEEEEEEEQGKKKKEEERRRKKKKRKRREELLSTECFFSFDTKQKAISCIFSFSCFRFSFSFCSDLCF